MGFDMFSGLIQVTVSEPTAKSSADKKILASTKGSKLCARSYTNVSPPHRGGASSRPSPGCRTIWSPLQSSGSLFV